jgi:NAD(P)-dependent dehydrogenase (short-subunit alcohol dehydrogenase family)
MTDMFRLDGKVAVVTGGGRGIGVMMARGLLQAGATVYLSSRKKAELDAAVAELSAHGPVQAIPADLGTIDGVEALVADLAERTDAVHALYNNAGAAWGAPLGEFPESGFDKVFNVNVKGVFLLTRAMVPMLTAGATEGDPARVINTGSIDGIVPPGRGRDNFSYSARALRIPDDQRAAAGGFGRRRFGLSARPDRPARRHGRHRGLPRQPGQ